MNGERCCAEDFGGSHYHCGNCNAVTGMYGHYAARVFPDGHGPRSVVIPGAHACSAEFEEQVLAALGDEAGAAYVARIRRGVPRFPS